MRSAPDDRSEENDLAMLEKENEAFDNHRLWKQLGTTPDEFFQAVRKHTGGLNVPEEKWRRAMDTARAVSERKVRERRLAARRSPISLGLIRV